MIQVILCIQSLTAVLSFFLTFLEAHRLTAFRCLASFLISRPRKKGLDDSLKDIPHVLVESKVNIYDIFLLV